MANYIANNLLIFIIFFLISRIPCARNIRGCLDVSKALAKKHKASGIPQHEVESIASCLLPAIQKFFESDDGKREFKEWDKQQKLDKR